MAGVFYIKYDAFAGEIWRPGSEHGKFTDSNSGKDINDMTKSIVYLL